MYTTMTTDDTEPTNAELRQTIRAAAGIDNRTANPLTREECAQVYETLIGTDQLGGPGTPYPTNKTTATELRERIADYLGFELKPTRQRQSSFCKRELIEVREALADTEPVALTYANQTARKTDLGWGATAYSTNDPTNPHRASAPEWHASPTLARNVYSWLVPTSDETRWDPTEVLLTLRERTATLPPTRAKFGIDDLDVPFTGGTVIAPIVAVLGSWKVPEWYPQGHRSGYVTPTYVHKHIYADADPVARAEASNAPVRLGDHILKRRWEVLWTTVRMGLSLDVAAIRIGADVDDLHTLLTDEFPFTTVNADPANPYEHITRLVSEDRGEVASVIVEERDEYTLDELATALDVEVETLRTDLDQYHEARANASPVSNHRLARIDNTTWRDEVWRTLGRVDDVGVELVSGTLAEADGGE